MSGPQINTLVRIESVWMAVSVDDDGTEGVCATMIGGRWMPLIAADETRLAFIREAAAMIAANQQRLVRVIRLNTREEVEVIDGRQ